MPISQVINPMLYVPSIADPASFEARADYTLNTGLQTRADEMNAYAAQANAVAADVNAQAAALTLNSTNDTSASSVVIGTGAKTFTVSASKSYVKGMYVVVADTAAPTVNSMFGIVNSYSGTTLDVVVLSIRGSGTKTAWTISQSAAGVTAETYTRTNALGAVSQSGGVPTGALIENVVNANGRAIKFADGTMICLLTRADISSNNTHTVGFVSVEILWVYPVAFADVPVVSGSAGNTSSVLGFASPTTLQASFKTWRAASGVSTAPCFMAIGRWTL